MKSANNYSQQSFLEIMAMAAKPQKNIQESASISSTELRPNAMSRTDAYRLYHAITQLKGLISEPKFVYALVMTRKSLQALAEAVEEMVKPPERIQQYEQQRQALCQELSVKDDQGKPMISADQHFVIDPQRQIEFNGRLSNLQKIFQYDIDSYRIASDNTNRFLMEASEIAIHPQIPISALGNSISVDQMEALLPILIR
jgi:hypothetical protein